MTTDPMRPPTIYDLCRPRQDVLAGQIRDEDFAADLSQVLKGTAPELYKNPALFFANTHPTRGLKDLIQAVVGRLSGADNQLGSILRLDTSYGGGKTHALIGLNHILTAPRQIPNLEEFVDPTALPSQPVTVAVFDGENADPMNGRRMEGDILATTPWGELAVQLAGRSGYGRIRNSDQLGAAPPGAETLRELMGERPVLILMDELSIYLRKLKGPAAGQAAEQLTPFLTDLIKAVNSLPNAVLVFTLALGRGGQAVDAYGEENQRIDRIFAELESVTGRQVTALTPTSEDETVQVLCRRLFASIDRSRVGEVVRAYQDLWRPHAEALPPVGQVDERAEALRKGYPFHPELIETLMQKTSTLENFQRVRGMLRLLAQTVAQLWREQLGDATAIHLHHVDPGNERIRLEIATKLGLQAFIPAIRADVARTSAEDGKALAQQLDTGEFAGLAPYGSLVARTVLLHSLAFNEPLKGLGRLELNYSLYAPGLDPAFIDKAVRHLQEASEYLDDSATSKLRFLTEANLNQMVRKREGQFDLETVRQELNRHIGVIFAKARRCFEPVVFPASPAEIPDDTDGPYLAVLHWEGHTVAQDHVHLPELVVRLFKERGDNANTRRNRNNLVFVCADRLQVDDMLRKTRTFLALGQMQQVDLFASLQTHQQEQVKERHGRAQQAFALAVQQAYRHVFYPERGPEPDVPLVHAAVTVTNASSEPGVGQKQVERVLRDAGELMLADDAPPAPNYMADKTPLRRLGVMSSRDLRNEYYRDPALPVLIGDEVLKKCLRMGLEGGVFVYKEGERLEGRGLPPGTLNVSEDAKIYMVEKAEELDIWPPRTAAPEPPPAAPPGSFTGADAPTTQGLGLSARTRSRGGGMALPTIPPPPGMLERTGNIKTILTQLAQQVSSSSKGIRSLTWRMNSGDGFVPLALLKAEPGATVQVEMMEGGWSSGDGAAEWSFDFKGTPEEAVILRGFIEGQWRRGGERSLDITYKLTYDPPLTWTDQGEDWIRRLTRAGLGAQTATVGLELSEP
ncbi:MAG: ATP-binding protein [Synechococcus sp. SB0678_bin_12]|nr:ATP-binding protein [Synechococcus sp. SB0678_bin_12]MYI88223.1 ATP-binding protein [Synechococcus sp. SB0672_bin_10]